METPADSYPSHYGMYSTSVRDSYSSWEYTSDDIRALDQYIPEEVFENITQDFGLAEQLMPVKYGMCLFIYLINIFYLLFIIFFYRREDILLMCLFWLSLFLFVSAFSVSPPSHPLILISIFIYLFLPPSLLSLSLFPFLPAVYLSPSFSSFFLPL